MKIFGKTPSSSPVLDLRQSSTKHSGRKPSKRQTKPNTLRLVGALGVVIVILIIAGSLYFINQKHESAKSQMQRTVDAVGRLMFLPSGETPTFGTVTDASKLKKQTFFAKSRTGDQVLIYEKARLSILYRPSAKKIVNVGPLITGSQGSPYLTSTIAIANGTDNDALLDKMTQAVTQSFPNARIVFKGRASRNYPTSIIIDTTLKNQPLDEQVADSLGIKSGKQPLAEPQPAADLFIIIGADYH